MTTVQKQCSRCGTCCTKGGPALHREDLLLIEQTIIERGRLVTIRKGELVLKPFQKSPQPAACELVKISGKGRDWQCYYFDEEIKGCSIYGNRPLSCRELECWNTAAVEELIEQDTITRFDLVSADEPIHDYMSEHEQSCPCPDMFKMYSNVLNRVFPKDDELEVLLNRDIKIRTAAAVKLKFTLAEELFYFGRPIFQLLQQLGGRVTEHGGELKITWPR